MMTSQHHLLATSENENGIHLFYLTSGPKGKHIKPEFNLTIKQ